MYHCCQGNDEALDVDAAKVLEILEGEMDPCRIGIKVCLKKFKRNFI